MYTFTLICTPEQDCHSYGVLIQNPDLTSHYLKLSCKEKDKQAFLKEYEAMNKITPNSCFPNYYHYYSSLEEILAAFSLDASFFHFLPDKTKVCALETDYLKDYIPLANFYQKNNLPVLNFTDFASIMQQLMNSLNLLYQNGCLYTDFNLNNIFLLPSKAYACPPKFSFIDFTRMLYYRDEQISPISMDIYSRKLLMPSYESFYGINESIQRKQVIFLHQMTSITALHLIGFMQIPFDANNLSATLSPNGSLYQQVVSQSGERIANCINYGFQFNGIINASDIFHSWKKKYLY